MCYKTQFSTCVSFMKYFYFSESSEKLVYLLLLYISIYMVEQKNLFFKLLMSHLQQKLTQGRVPMMSHASAPDYLRTKPDPQVEQQEVNINSMVSNNPDPTNAIVSCLY